MSDEDWGFIDNMLAEMFIRSEVLTRVRGCFCNIQSGEVMRVEETGSSRARTAHEQAGYYETAHQGCVDLVSLL